LVSVRRRYAARNDLGHVHRSRCDDALSVDTWPRRFGFPADQRAASKPNAYGDGHRHGDSYLYTYSDSYGYLYADPDCSTRCQHY